MSRDSDVIAALIVQDIKLKLLRLPFTVIQSIDPDIMVPLGVRTHPGLLMSDLWSTLPLDGKV